MKSCRPHPAILPQDLSGGSPVKITSPLGDELPLWGLQLDPEQVRCCVARVCVCDAAMRVYVCVCVCCTAVYGHCCTVSPVNGDEGAGFPAFCALGVAVTRALHRLHRRTSCRRLFPTALVIPHPLALALAGQGGAAGGACGRRRQEAERGGAVCVSVYVCVWLCCKTKRQPAACLCVDVWMNGCARVWAGPGRPVACSACTPPRTTHYVPPPDMFLLDSDLDVGTSCL